MKWVAWHLGLIKLKKWQKFSKRLKKFASFFKRDAKIRNVEMLKLFYYHQKLCGNLPSNLRVGCLTSRFGKTRKTTKFSKTLKKFASFFQKNAKIRNVEMLKLFYYHQKLCGNLSSNLRVGCLTSRVEKTQKNDKHFQKAWKNLQVFI